MPAGSDFAICRTEKIKSWATLKKSVGHNLRTSADDRQHLNPAAPEGMRILAGSADWVDEWKEQVSGMWLPNLKQGTQHTLAREFFLGVSPDHFKGKSKAEVDEWAKANVAWLHERFGKERVKLVCLHLDEQTEHLAAYIVPLKADLNRKGQPNARGNGWTLSDSALGLGGSKDALSMLQDEYAAAMKRFELRRGVKGSKAKHQTVAAWRKQMAKPLDPPLIQPKPIAPTLADRINIEGYGERVAKAVADDVYRQMKPFHQQAKAQAKQAKEQAKELAAIKSQLDVLQPLADMLKQLLEMIMGGAPDFHSMEGRTAAMAALTPFIKTAREEAAPLNMAPEKRAQRAKPSQPQSDKEEPSVKKIKS